MLAKLTAALLLTSPLLFPLGAWASEDMEFISPTKVDKVIYPQGKQPIDLSKVQITTLTPADRFVNATTPLVVSLAMGSLALVAYTLIQGSKERDGE